MEDFQEYLIINIGKFLIIMGNVIMFKSKNSRILLFPAILLTFYVSCDGSLDGFTNLGSNMYSNDIYESKRRDVFIEEYEISNNAVFCNNYETQLLGAWKEYEWTYKNIFKQTKKSERTKIYLRYKSKKNVARDSFLVQNENSIRGFVGTWSDGVFILKNDENRDSIKLVFCNNQEVIISINNRYSTKNLK